MLEIMNFQREEVHLLMALEVSGHLGDGAGEEWVSHCVVGTLG